MNSSTIDLQQALDREAIREVIVRYYDAIWQNDIDTVIGLFAEKGGIEVANGPLAGQSAYGADALRSFYKAGIATMTPRPFGHNHVVEIKSDSAATGRSYVELRSSVDFSSVGTVIYADTYIKLDRKWLVNTRRAVMQNLADSKEPTT